MELNSSIPAQAVPPQAATPPQTPPETIGETDAELFATLFNQADKDASEGITIEEFGDLLTEGVGKSINNDVVAHIHNEADISGDGILDQDELSQFLDSALSVGTEPEPEPTGSAVPGAMDFLALNFVSITEVPQKQVGI